MRHFCTLFNSYYQYHAFNLYDSLSKNHKDFKLYCLCMDKEALEYIKKFDHPNFLAIDISDVETTYPELIKARNNRSYVEYFFTCTPVICQYLLQTLDTINEIVYLDADLYFFDTPEIVFDEIKDASISIIPHRFTGLNKQRNVYGYYNVGWVSFKKDENGLACLNDWFVKCIAWCYDKLEGDKYADQKYLNAWPEKFDKVHSIKNIGANAAPWNIGNYNVTLKNKKIYLDNQPLVFYHYASLKWIEGSFYTTCSSYFARLKPIIKNEIYLPYINKLLQSGFVPKTGLRQKKDFLHTIVRKLIRFVYGDKIQTGIPKFDKLKLFMLVHLPPPVHGASLINKNLYDSISFNNKFLTTYCNLSTSANLNEIGKFGIRKLFTIFSIQYAIIKSILFEKQDLYYISLTTKSIGFLKDAILIFVLKLFSKKIIYHINNKGVEEFQDKVIYRFLYKKVFSNVDVILTSPLLYRDVKKFVKKERVYYCPNGIEEVTINISRKNSKDFNILYLSNLMREKGVFELLKACFILKNMGFRFICNFVGSFVDIKQSDFIKQIDDYGLGDCVFYCGSKYGNDKYEYFVNSDVFVLPTYYTVECFPLSILEAMQFKLPVISTEHAAIPEIIDNGVNGYIIPIKNSVALAEKLQELIENDSLRLGFGKNAERKFRENYTLKKFEENLETIITEVYKKTIATKQNI